VSSDVVVAGTWRRQAPREQPSSASASPRRTSVAGAIVRPNALVGAITATLVTMTTTEYLHARHVWTLFAVVVAGAGMAREMKGLLPWM